MVRVGGEMDRGKRKVLMVALVAPSLVLAAFGAVASAPASGPAPATGIGPGAATMSEEEKAIVADPNIGAEHGVVLLWDQERDEKPAEYTRHALHIRAKILSNEGRSLGDVEIPYNMDDGELKTWWAKTILPDGAVQDLPLESLKDQEIERQGGRRVHVLKGAMPGVVPGCVVDYGYVFHAKTHRTLSRWWRFDIQRSWPLREMRYTWKPYEWLAHGFSPTRTQGLNIRVEGFTGNVNVVGLNLPAVPEEPYMPADNAVRAAVSLYYFNKKESHADYWNSEAKKLAGKITAFSNDPKAVKAAIAAMTFPENADLDTKVKIAFEWVNANVKNRYLKTSEEEESIGSQPEEKTPKTAGDVLAAREAAGYEIDQLFVALARGLGAEADLVLATDRTDHYWDRGLMTTDQFDWTLVAVRPPGSPEAQSRLVDVASGLDYGEIPWWVAGTNGLMMTAAGAKEILLPASKAASNVSETKAEIALAPGGTISRARWTHTGAGQQGLLERRSLRRRTPEARKARLDELCGAGADFEVSKAEAPRIDDLGAGFALECEGASPDADAEAGAQETTFRLAGAWFDPVPELSAPVRVHPIVFDYPRIDRSILEIESPEGYAPKGAPAPVKVDGPFGSYSLVATATPTGYHVERSFSLNMQNFPPDRYAGIRKYLSDVRKADRASVEFRRASVASP